MRADLLDCRILTSRLVSFPAIPYQPLSAGHCFLEFWIAYNICLFFHDWFLLPVVLLVSYMSYTCKEGLTYCDSSGSVICTLGLDSTWGAPKDYSLSQTKFHLPSFKILGVFSPKDLRNLDAICIIVLPIQSYSSYSNGHGSGTQLKAAKWGNEGSTK